MVKSNIDKKFSAHYDAVEAELKSSTVGNYTCNASEPCSPSFHCHVMLLSKTSFRDTSVFLKN